MNSAPRPLALLAELTYQCPLHCPYCSNPVKYASGLELSAAEWTRVIREAAEIGVLHAGFSGGEPLARADLAKIINAAAQYGLYSNLITSGVGLSLQRGQELKAAGLDSIQLSFQAHEHQLADSIAGARVHSLKLQAAENIKAVGLPLSINVVLHRKNIDRIEQMILVAEQLGASRLELANTQYYGWAFENMGALMPTAEQIRTAREIASAAAVRLRGKMTIIHVLADYFAERPKPCMNGWGQTHLTVNPVGDVLPCPNAAVISELQFDSVRKKNLAEIWASSDAFQRFRGTEWMKEPCRSCELRNLDFGGCRCQAALITGDADATDPACSLSDAHLKMVALKEKDTHRGFVYRQNPVS